MTQELTTTIADALTLAQPRPLDQNAAAVYLAGMSEGSRRTMQAALDTIAALVSGGQADGLALDWPQLRFQHTAAIRAKLAESYAPATTNKMPSALGVPAGGLAAGGSEGGCAAAARWSARFTVPVRAALLRATKRCKKSAGLG